MKSALVKPENLGYFIFLEGGIVDKVQNENLRCLFSPTMMHVDNCNCNYITIFIISSHTIVLY